MGPVDIRYWEWSFHFRCVALPVGNPAITEREIGNS